MRLNNVNPHLGQRLQVLPGQMMSLDYDFLPLPGDCAGFGEFGQDRRNNQDRGRIRILKEVRMHR
jgi:hypothetical protein